MMITTVQSLIDLSFWNIMIKPDPKVVLTDDAHQAISAVQTIVYPGSKAYNALFGPHLTVLFQRILKLLPPNIILMSNDPEEVFQRILKKMRPFMGPDVLEGDISKYDKSEDLTALWFDVIMFLESGMPLWKALTWFVTHYNVKVYGFNLGFKTRIPTQRRSGGPWTFQGNSLYLVACIIDSIPVYYLILVAGDDSEIFGPFNSKEKEEICHRLVRNYQFDVKLCTFKSLYFCSRLIVTVGVEMKILPDPI